MALPTGLKDMRIIGLLPSLFALQVHSSQSLKKTVWVALELTRMPADSLLQGSYGWLPLASLLLIGAILLLVMAWREKLLRSLDLVIFLTIIGGTLLYALVSMPNAFGADGWLITKETHKFLATWIYGAAFLAMLIWLIAFGHRRGSDLYVWAALASFAVEVLYIYFSIFGSLLETSLFFLVGGILTIGLAYFLYRLHQRLEGPSTPVSEAVPHDQFKTSSQR